MTPGGEAGFDALLCDIRACRLCASALPHAPRPVLRARPSARILIAGQAPGARVHASGMPFTDPSGVRLRDWLGIDEAVFYDERRIAIVPMGFCYPGTDEKGADLPPRRECAPAWRARVLAHLPRLRLTLLVGAHAQKWHLGARAKPSLTETVRAFPEYGPRMIPLPHPSWRNTGWLKRNPWFEAELLPVLRARVAALLEGRA